MTPDLMEEGVRRVFQAARTRRSAGVIFDRRSFTSIEKSTSSTVHVFLIAFRYIS